MLAVSEAKLDLIVQMRVKPDKKMDRKSVTLQKYNYSVFL